ncbi:serine/threonine-protein kinase [Tabrizicola sp.]|uniref:serine/threonine protein kinase n=1 Tax=Tabrizicola sp. TaxID=2005166 RepID=UPI00286A751D|nr:serine/threonine-protein kinase [Tabrizicola sp.]
MIRFNRAAKVAPVWTRTVVSQREPKLVTKPQVQEEAFAEPELTPDTFVDELKQGSTLLQGQFTIISYLNSGGFGITYLAKNSLDRTVVIKECFPNALCRRSGNTVRARSRAHQGEFRTIVRLFVQEAHSLSKLVHPSIVGVHQVFEDNDTAYMAIDYINGKDLLDILEENAEPFTPAEVVGLLKKVLGAVDFVHQSGMLHRDISPDNILVDHNKQPILIDFGAAREQATRASRVMSARRVVKDGYSPQEFYLTGAAQGTYSDLYALAATFVHIIAGEAPPESQRRLAAIAEGREDPYRPLTGAFEGYPPQFLEAIDKAVRVLPKDRLQTAKEWLDIIALGEAEAAGPTAQVVPLVLVPPPFPKRLMSRRFMTAPAPVAPAVQSRTARKLSIPVLSGVASLLALTIGLGVWSLEHKVPQQTVAGFETSSPKPRPSVPPHGAGNKVSAAVAKGETGGTSIIAD